MSTMLIRLSSLFTFSFSLCSIYHRVSEISGSPITIDTTKGIISKEVSVRKTIFLHMKSKVRRVDSATTSIMHHCRTNGIKQVHNSIQALDFALRSVLEEK
jgi:hypothetical protein